MKVQKFKVWPESDTDLSAQAETFQCTTPEDAAEFYAEDNYDGWTGGQKFCVEAEDGTVYVIEVEVEVKPRATVKN